MSAQPPQSRDSNQRRPVATGSLPEQVLAHAQAGREIIQDSVELAASLEWTLGQEYLRQRGNKAFLSDSSPVPFVVNNDGTLSRNAAEVFFASLQVAERHGTLEDEIVVLELGIGVGLFARYFLDAMRELSRQHHKDYYDQLTYIAADRSERMLEDVLRHGVLGGHPGRYCVRQVDAMEPAAGLSPHPRPLSPAGRGEKEGGRLRAVFLNYLLDCLPAAVLEFDGDAVRQLCVQTCVGRNVRLADYTDLTAEQLRQRAARLPPHPQPLSPGGERGEEGRARDELLEVYGLFGSVYDYEPVDPRTLPYGEFAVEYGRSWTKC